jgi:hypothetical protein
MDARFRGHDGEVIGRIWYNTSPPDKRALRNPSSDRRQLHPLPASAALSIAAAPMVAPAMPPRAHAPQRQRLAIKPPVEANAASRCFFCPSSVAASM